MYGVHDLDIIKLFNDSANRAAYIFKRFTEVFASVRRHNDYTLFVPFHTSKGFVFKFIIVANRRFKRVNHCIARYINS